FLGTPQYDQVYFIDIDEEESIYAAGQTTGSYPVTRGTYSNPNSAQFIHKLTTELDSTFFSTVFGSGTPVPNISPTAFLANECGNLFLSGWGGVTNERNTPTTNVGNTFNLPITPDALNPSTDGSDFYLMVLSADGSELLYATYYGSTNNGGDHVDGGTSRFDKRGIVYQATCSCGGSVDDFPTTLGAWSTINNGVNAAGDERCNNAAFKFDLATLKARFITSEEDGGNIGIERGCVPLDILFTNTSTGGEEAFWDFGNGITSNEEDSLLVRYETPGVYPVTLIVRDENTCSVEDTFISTIQVFDEEVTISDNVRICEGSSAQIFAEGGVSYRWSPEVGLDNTSISNPIASPATGTTYEVEITTPNGCIKTASVAVAVDRLIVEDFEVVETFNCSGYSTFEFINNTIYQGDFLWDFGDGSTSNERNPTHFYSEEGTYTVNLAIDEICVVEKEVELEAIEAFFPNVITPNGDGLNDVFQLESPGDIDLTIVSRNGSPVYEYTRYSNDWDGGDFPSGVYYYTARLQNGTTCKGWVQVIR
ncbi:MAG: PKD domain-containing protein, partial [Bacteroidota bacterium]